jgi:Tol biopolymer transport system component
VTQWVTHDPVLDVYPAWSPTGDAIYFSSQRGGGINLWRMPVDAAGRPNGPARQLTTGAGQDVEVAASPDGRQLAFVTLKQNADLWQLPVSPSGTVTGQPSQLVATSREDSRGAWSPDGRSVAFNSDRAENMNIWLHSLDGSADRPLTHGAGGDYQPTWSPDAKTLVFFSSRAGTADIWAVDIHTGALRRLTDSSSLEINPIVSPDGRFIAYQSDQDGRMAPWVMQADGNAQRQLAGITVAGHFLRWSPDSAHVIARQAGTGATGLATLVQVSLDGGQVQPFADIAGGSHFSPSPDYSRVIDVVGHKALWLSRRGAGAPVKLFAFSEPDARIDYPMWSRDGRAVLFDRFQPQGGDIWLLSDFR